MSDPASGNWTQLRVTTGHNSVKNYTCEKFQVAELFKQLPAIHKCNKKGHISNTTSKTVFDEGESSDEQIRLLLKLRLRVGPRALSRKRITWGTRGDEIDSQTDWNAPKKNKLGVNK